MVAKKSKKKKQEDERSWGEHETAPKVAALMTDFLNQTEEFWRKNPKGFSDYLMSKYHAGDRTALMKMIYWSARLGLLIPQWAAAELVQRCDLAWFGHFRLWDDVLGPLHPKGTDLANLRRRQQSVAIYLRCRDIKEQEGAPIDDGLFERVGKEFGMKKTLCSELYGECNQREKDLQAAIDIHLRQNPETPGNT
jgi:hypothetical protein